MTLCHERVCFGAYTRICGTHTGALPLLSLGKDIHMICNMLRFPIWPGIHFLSCVACERNQNVLGTDDDSDVVKNILYTHQGDEPSHSCLRRCTV